MTCLDPSCPVSAARVASLRRNYRNIFDAVHKIMRSEGALGMWRSGLLPNMNRAMIVAVGQLAAYDQCKQTLVNMGAPDSVSTPLHPLLAWYHASL